MQQKCVTKARPLADVANFAKKDGSMSKKRTIHESFAAQNLGNLQDISMERQKELKSEMDLATCMQMLDLTEMKFKQFEEAFDVVERMADQK